MSATPTEPLLQKRVRLLPWRGPVHFLLLLVTSSLTLFLPLLYVLMVGCLALGILYAGHGWIHHLAYAPELFWWDALPFTYLAASIVTWIFMLRPLQATSSKQGVAAVVIHFVNVIQSSIASNTSSDSDPCTW